MDTVLTAARDLGLPRPVRIWTESPDEEVAARDWGMAPDRHLHRVARPLPLGRTGAFPDGFSVRPFVLTAMEQWLEANNRAFSDHPDNGAWTAGDVEERIQLPWFEAAGFLTVWHGSRLVGTNWTKVHAGGVGEIYVIFVDPDYQGRGLGRATAAAGLEHLTASGCRRASLYVEGTNFRALSLYDALGFRTESTAIAFSEG